MSLVKQYYHVTLQAGDGTEWKWQGTNNYFNRRMEVINREMQAAIRKHDEDNQFSLTENPHQRDCPWYGVNLDSDDACDQMDDTPCTCEKKYQVTLLNLETNVTHREKFLATDRYAAVAKAFKYFAYKPQAECLDTWKVYDAREIS